MPVVLRHYQWSFLLVDALSHYHRYHIGLVLRRNTHVCLYLSIPGGGSWCSKWHEAQSISSASITFTRTLRQSKLHYHAQLDQCAVNSTVPEEMYGYCLGDVIFNILEITAHLWSVSVKQSWDPCVRRQSFTMGPSHILQTMMCIKESTNRTIRARTICIELPSQTDIVLCTWTRSTLA